MSFRILALPSLAESEGKVGILTMAMSDFDCLCETTKGIDPWRLCDLSEHGLDIHYNSVKGFRLGGSRELGISEQEVDRTLNSALKIDLTQAMRNKKTKREIFKILDQGAFEKQGMSEVYAQLGIAETLPDDF